MIATNRYPEVILMKKIKVLSVFGTRPEAIKMAPLALELKSHPEIDAKICVTAQHREMLDSVLSIFNLKADFDLDIMKAGQTLSDITSRILYGMQDVFSEYTPDLVLVHGDTTTSFTVALAAFYSGIAVGHVEAGLRSFDRNSPFPEEMNRRLNGQLCTLHFAPTAQNRINLEKEGVDGEIFVTGNTVIDALKYTASDESLPMSEYLSGILDYSKKIITLTCHRRENFGEPMDNIFTAVKNIAEANDELLFIYPVHPNPIVKDKAEEILGDISNVKLISPLDAFDMHKLMAKSYFIMTDSGGIQEEAPALGKPVLVLRRETERPEAIEAGTVALAGTDREKIQELALELLNSEEKYNEMANAVNPYGDGLASARIADSILYYYGVNDKRPADFCSK